MKYIELKEIGFEKTIRFDCDYITFQSNFETLDYFRFNDLFDIVKDNEVNLQELEDNDFYYAEIGNSDKNGDVEPVLLNFNNRNEFNENYFKKIEKGDIIKAKDGDILISKVRPNLKKYILIDSEKEQVYYTSAFIHLRPKKIGKILYYQLRTRFYNNLIAISRQGKGYPTLSTEDLPYLKFSKNTIKAIENNEKIITSKIQPIEQQIKELKSKIIDQKQIINEVFAREFGFDINLYNEFGKGMTAGTQIAENKTMRIFEIDFSDIVNSNTLRFSTRFHNLPTQKLMNILDKIETIAVKDVVNEYQKGIQPNYNSDGEIQVVKIANLKDSYIDFSETENITQNDFDVLQNEKKLIKNDIILCATGKISLGKIDYYDYEQEAITTVDNYILRLKENFNPLFFTYFFRSVLGYFQIERDFTGATNQIHLYWEQISNFKLPNLPLLHQQKIVNEIKTKIDKQNEINKQIETLRGKIDEIINEVVESVS